MRTVSNQRTTTGRFALHGYAGILIMGAAEVLLFSGNQLVGHWFTPVVWTGYILFVDALVYKLKGRSLLMSNRLEFLVVVMVSIGGWWLFEFYNAPRFWRSNLELWWHYHNLEPNLWVRRVGYDWAFATITPALLETAELFGATLFKHQKKAPQLKLSRSLLAILVLLGAVGVIVPLIFPNEWFAPVIWLSFIFFLDPLNALWGWPSITSDLARGEWWRLFSLLASGLLCGFLWEFWNYWALSKWTYTVPYFGNVKIFEMPVFGYLGFPPFALECWAMYIFVRSVLSSERRETADNEIFLSADA
ncbi:MAG TPA: hypothetical protein VGQ72_07520 [Pyrinomonadaceae bacterium]|jgi:hypothetical protein|nr:hypothetical protein [Pyrinomonadaceae bacterium]